MTLVGFAWVFANVVLSLIILTLLAYAVPSSLAGRTAAIIK